jgi:hypothetical protein
VNLRKITSRAKKIYILFEGIGIDKIQAVTYSASAISSLIEIQIQGIISCFPKTYKSSTDDTDECQKMISVTNHHAHVTESSEISVPTAPLTRISNSSGPEIVSSTTSKASVSSATSRTQIPRTDPNKMECLYQYAVEHGLDSEKFSIVTEAEKKNGTVNSS